MDRNNEVTEDILLSSFGGFDKKIEFVCISHVPTLKIGTIIRKKYKKNIFHYFINNEPTDLSSDWSKFKGNYPMMKKIVRQHSNSKDRCFIDKVYYKIWKHLDKKLKSKGILIQQ